MEQINIVLLTVFNFFNGGKKSELPPNYKNIETYGKGNGNAQVNFADNSDYVVIAGNLAVAFCSGSGINYGFGLGFGFGYVFDSTDIYE